MVSYSESFPLDGALTLGFGGLFGEGDDVFLLLPIGISLGRRFDVEGSSTTFVPYVHPNIVPVFGGGDDDVEFTLGLGVDIRFSERWAVRASGGLGDIEGVGVSIAYVRSQRRVRTPGRGSPSRGDSRRRPRALRGRRCVSALRWSHGASPDVPPR